MKSGLSFKGNLDIQTKRGAESRQLMLTWLPIIFNIALTIGLAVIAILPFWWALKLILVIVYSISLYKYCFFSVGGMRRIFNMVFKFKVYFDNHEF